MRKLIAALIVLLVMNSYAQTGDPQAIAQAFSGWGNFLVGGVWTSTHAQGDKLEERWEWVLDRSFLQVRWKLSGDSGISLVGIDPSTGKLTWWGFDHKGRVWKGTTNLDKPGEWVDEGTGHGTSGPNSWKTTLTRLGADRARLEIRENVVDGKAFAPEVIILSRKK
jgi:hypothetical protein